MSVMFPAGTYYIGDLCYVLSEVWDEFCDKYLDSSDELITLSDGRKIWWNSTAYGDGTYLDNEGNKYDVDAGLIGIILWDDIKWEIEENQHSSLIKHRFKKLFQVSTDGLGRFIFGHIVIDTGDEDDGN